MQIQEAIFVTSSATYKTCPPADKAEIAFIGRSNVGKSSLINTILGKKGLAKTSAKPGKTQLINHFLVNNKYHLVDLPGYGWAQASKTKRIGWNKMVNHYLLYRENLACLFVLIDIRLPPQHIDLLFIDWLIENNTPFCIILTKADKISKQQVINQLANLKRALTLNSKKAVKCMVTSSKNQVGRLEMLEHITQIVTNHQQSQ
jgi:GTP-binding protein